MSTSHGIMQSTSRNTPGPKRAERCKTKLLNNPVRLVVGRRNVDIYIHLKLLCTANGDHDSMLRGCEKISPTNQGFVAENLLKTCFFCCIVILFLSFCIVKTLIGISLHVPQHNRYPGVHGFAAHGLPAAIPEIECSSFRRFRIGQSRSHVARNVIYRC